ncbi:MAG TPA: hypothetical protein VEU47_18765 [Candidatus Cybelea sp.]|nr:hypothetical protein [Candidatus Cybelea sp.]
MVRNFEKFFPGARTMLLSAAIGLAAAMAEAAPPQLVVERAGDPQTVFAWNTMHCEQWDIPDAPARAWRDADGGVHLVASHYINREMAGPDLNHLRQDCRIVYQGGNDDLPQHYDDRSWIASTYSLDGKTVFALVHNEFHGHLRPALCPSREYIRCWENTLTMVTSRDGGATFTHEAPPWQYVAGLPYRYRGDIGHQIGYFNPSNIVQRGAFYYAFFWAEAEGAQQRGACLMRTDNLADRRAWRGWDGKDFTVVFEDPYVVTAMDPAKHTCAPVSPSGLPSIVTGVALHRPSGLYVAVMATRRPLLPGGAPVNGVYASTSPDLIHWSDPALIWSAPVLFNFACSDRDAIFYPALLDPSDTSRNFEDVGDHAFIYATDLHIKDCKLGSDRDLLRFPVTISLRK